MRKIVLGILTLALAAPLALQAAEYYTKHKGDRRRAEPVADTALVYVFRPASVGGAIKTWAFADEQLIGVSKPKGYYFAHVPPGKRLIWAKAENTSAVEVEMEAGETYYFKTAIRMGWGKARVKMMRIDEAEAEKYWEKCSFCELTDAGRERGAEISANRIERARSQLAEDQAEAAAEAEGGE